MLGVGWTDERITVLKRLWTDGMTASKIACELGGVTRSAVIGKVHRLGLHNGSRSNLPSRSARPRKPRAARATPPSKSRAERIATGPLVCDEPLPSTPESDLAIPLAQRRSVLELNGVTCRWPVGEPGAPGFFFCGALSDNAVDPYCGAHQRRAYVGIPSKHNPKPWRDNARRV